MTTPLSDPIFDQLSPLLANLARLISANSPCSDTQLLTLLEAIDLENDDDTLVELRKWAALLKKSHQNSNADQRMATIEALQLRGLREAQVQLAVDMVCSAQSSPSLTVQPNRLEWNNLAAGESVETILKIEGGPGQLEAGSDHIILSSTNFPEMESEIKVTIHSLSPGSILNNFIKIINQKGSLEIPVIAEWKLEPDRNHIDTQADLIVAIDEGSFNLNEVIEQAEAGQSILIRCGTYYLEKPLLIEKSLSLVGEGQDKTRIYGKDGSYVAFISTSNEVNIREISFIYEGSEPSNCVKVVKGKVNISRCSFQGAVPDEVEISNGAGLRLLENANGEISNCSFFNNGGSGLYLGGKCNFRLIENICRDNKWNGISYLGSSSGAAFDNLLEGNGKSGMYVYEEALPRVEGNTCRENKQSGISYFGNAAGEAHENLCEGNNNYGISINDEAKPRLKANTSISNLKGDIHRIDGTGE